jgi:hypothetical protein
MGCSGRPGSGLSFFFEPEGGGDRFSLYWQDKTMTGNDMQEKAVPAKGAPPLFALVALTT